MMAKTIVDSKKYGRGAPIHWGVEGSLQIKRWLNSPNLQSVYRKDMGIELKDFFNTPWWYVFGVNLVFVFTLGQFGERWQLMENIKKGKQDDVEAFIHWARINPCDLEQIPAVVNPEIAYQQYQIKNLQIDNAGLQLTNKNLRATLDNLNLANQSLKTAVETQKLVLEHCVRKEQYAENQEAIQTTIQVSQTGINNANYYDDLVHTVQRGNRKIQVRFAEHVKKLFKT